MKSTRLLLAIPLLPALAATALALDISWPMTGTVPLGTPEGFTVEAIQSNPPGQPLLLGRPSPNLGDPRFQPLWKKGSLTFGPTPNFAYVANFWKNSKNFTVEVDLQFDSVASAQTVLAVVGSWELRMDDNQGAPTLEWIAYRRKPLKPVAASIPGIEAGKRYTIQAKMKPDGQISLQVDGKSEASATLGEPPADWNVMSSLLVGSAGPEKFRRPLLGSIYRIQISGSPSP
jgi:hypothetical protein